MSSKILIKVYLSKEDKEAIQKHTKKLGIKDSSFLRDLALKEINSFKST